MESPNFTSPRSRNNRNGNFNNNSNNNSNNNNNNRNNQFNSDPFMKPTPEQQATQTVKEFLKITSPMSKFQNSIGFSQDQIRQEQIVAENITTR